MAFSSCFSLVTSAPLFSTIGSQIAKLPTVSRRSPTSTFIVRAQQHQPVMSSIPVVERRSGHYQPCVWEDDAYLQSITNPYSGEMYTEKAQKLIAIVRVMLNSTDESFDQRLELIDSLERLGLAYHFTSEIKDVLQHAYTDMTDTNNGGDDCTLHITALKFRLLRDHGYRVSQDIFCSFVDKNGGFKAGICSDVKGILSLYEASFYGVEGESIMDEAMDFSTKYLKAAEKNLNDPNLVMKVKHALEVPLRCKEDRFEARWSIEALERAGDINPLLIELSKLDYNIVQAMYLNEVKEMSRWWKNTNLAARASFSRNKLLSSYLWGVGVAGPPRFVNSRKMVAKSIEVLAVMDDMYDIYGTLDELQLFTDVVDRWDVIYAMKQLPEYMKICFLALYNFVNEIAYDVLKEQDSDVLLYLKNAWSGLLRAYLVEAKWYHTASQPTLQEYLNNGWVSIAMPMIITMCYATEAKPVSEKVMEHLEAHPDILRLTSSIVRFEDDLGTSSDELNRGDILKAIQCYMRETGASEEAAREYVRQLAREAWRKINKCLTEDGPLPQYCVKFMLNFARVSHFFYMHGDGHSVEEYTKELASTFLFDPIPINYKEGEEHSSV